MFFWFSCLLFFLGCCPVSGRPKSTKPTIAWAIVGFWRNLECLLERTLHGTQGRRLLPAVEHGRPLAAPAHNVGGQRYVHLTPANKGDDTCGVKPELNGLLLEIAADGFRAVVDAELLERALHVRVHSPDADAERCGGLGEVPALGREGLDERLTLLGGVRKEWVTTDTFVYFRARTTPIAVEPDHFKRAAMDYQKLSKDGDYSRAFPSVHAAYDITENLKARASWSTSYGRAALAKRNL